MRRLIIGTASVLALGIAGAALDNAVDAGSAEDAGSMPSTFEASPTSATAAMLWKDDIRWAQLELRNRGLYNGSLDGIIGTQTKRGLEQFQRYNGLKRTAALDPKTLDALIGNVGIGYGSSKSTDAEGHKSMANRSGSSSLSN
jgi:peptidoglycan hydrolase-like protein with peptidoglycan-binding domain